MQKNGAVKKVQDAKRNKNVENQVIQNTLILIKDVEKSQNFDFSLKLILFALNKFRLSLYTHTASGNQNQG